MIPTHQRDPALLADSWPLLHAHSLTIRALQPEHADLEVRFGLALSRESRYERFLGGGVKLTPELLARLVNVDFARDVALIATVAFGGIGAAIALRSGSASVVQGLFPLVFVILFLSTAFFPEDLLLEPARSVAEWNPLSFIVDGVRNLIISTFSAGQFFEGVAALVLMGLFGIGLSAAAMRGRLKRG